jgi:hypothetical protein
VIPAFDTFDGDAEAVVEEDVDETIDVVEEAGMEDVDDEELGVDEETSVEDVLGTADVELVAGMDRNVDNLINDEADPLIPAVIKELELLPVTKLEAADVLLEELPTEVDAGTGGNNGVPFGPKRTAP